MGGGLFGVVEPAAPAALGELGIGTKRFHTSVGMLWLPEQSLDFGPGRLDETLLSAVARTCFTATRSAELRVDLCSGVYAGLIKVRADGYTQDDSASKPWLAVPLELALSTTSEPVGVEVGVSALLPLKRNDFSRTEQLIKRAHAAAAGFLDAHPAAASEVATIAPKTMRFMQRIRSSSHRRAKTENETRARRR